MNMVTTEELREMARRHRSFREAGAALLISSIVLALFIFIPLKPAHKATQAITVATSTPQAPFITAPIEARAAIVYDLATGETLYEKNADAQLPLASLTKLLTVYAAVSALPGDSVVTVSREAAFAEAPHTFHEGSRFTLDDIARLTLTASLNDGAIAIVEAAAAARERSTIDTLAATASALDLKETYALNGNGLDLNTAVSGAYGSARDMATLAGALVAKAPHIALATTHGSASGSSLDGAHYTVKNTDPVTGHLPRLLLSKTGFTDLAGGNLALVFDAGLAHPIAVVVLGSSKAARFTDSMALVDATLNYFAGVRP
jgi:D-alanyl-D-alanine carboxypeptidase